MAAGAYAAMFALAPRITLLGMDLAARPIPARFQVQLRGESAPAPPEEDRSALSSTPGSVRDLLERDPGDLAALELPKEREAPIPRFEERIAADTIQRPHDLDRENEAVQRIDARILEISQETARKDIQVARRFVRPSPSRIVEENEFPALRSPLAEEDSRPLRFQAPARSLLTEGIGEGRAQYTGTGLLPEYEEGVLDLKGAVPEEAGKDTLPVVSMLENRPVLHEMEAAKKEGQKSYAFIDDLVSIDLDTYQPPGEPQGFFRLRILPKEGKGLDPLPKNVTFVVDASSSIGQRKLDLTARGLRESIAQLRPEDHFNITAFRGTPKSFREQRVPATPENIQAALSFLDTLEAIGETDVYQGILPVVQESPAPGTPGILLVVSDGRPTTGMRDGRTIINGLTADNNLRNSIYAFGGGRQVNRYLLDLLAYRNKGACEVTPRMEDVSTALPQFFASLSDPLLVDVHTDYGRLDEDTVFPSVLPDFYRGQPVTVYGQFNPAKDDDFVMRLTGRARDTQKEVVFRANLEGAQSGDAAIAQQWAFQKAYYIIGEISRLGERPELLEELRELSRKYGIRTSYDE